MLLVVVLFGLAVAECALLVARSRWLFSLLFFLNHQTPPPQPPNPLFPGAPQPTDRRKQIEEQRQRLEALRKRSEAR